jgi:glycosyltransferase involved in cell wall biosynthesis
MPVEDSISVIVPAFNEEADLEATVNEVVAAVEGDFDEYEILVFDDCSTDGTGAAADRTASRNQHVRVFHNERNRGLGWNYRTGIRVAEKTYVALFNGKHDKTADQIKAMLAQRGKADLIIPYHTNENERSVFRQVVSRAFTSLLNTIFGFSLRYYNGSVLHRRSLLNSIVLHTDSYAFQAEAVIKLLRRGHSYVEVPMRSVYREGVETKAFQARNVWGVAKFMIRIVYDVYFTRQYRRETGP